MSDPIEPALPDSEWRYWSRDPSDVREAIDRACDTVSYDLRQKPERLIALANAALPDGDPRKITRAKIDALSEAVAIAGSEWVDDAVHHFVDALSSYLPPEEP